MTSPPASAGLTGSSGTIPPVPGGSAARRIPFDEAAVAAVAAVLGADAVAMPFGARAGGAWRMTIPFTGMPVVLGQAPPTPEAADQSPGDTPVPTTTVTIWPGLGRVDLGNPMVSVTASAIEVVDLIDGIETIFRSAAGSATVARNGRVMVRMGPTNPTGEPERSAGR